MEGLKRTGEQIGGIERFQLAKRVLCASIAEREPNASANVQHFFDSCKHFLMPASVFIFAKIINIT